MADTKLPYVPTYGVIGRTLDKIKAAATPSRFTQDFLATKLQIKGGSGRPVIPFLKRVGFLSSDGSPTDLYKRFRNPSESGSAAAEAVRTGYAPLYEMNEYVHDLSDKDLRGLIVQATGLEPKSGTIKAIVGSYKVLRTYADFEAEPQETSAEAEEGGTTAQPAGPSVPLPQGMAGRLGLSYTINLNLPATSDVAVFDAIFKSLREHLLR